MTASSRAVAAIWVTARRHRPGNRRGIELGHRQAGRRQHDGEEQQGEGQAEQEAHVGGADRAERGRQLLLHGVAQHLAAGSRRP